MRWWPANFSSVVARMASAVAILADPFEKYRDRILPGRSGEERPAGRGSLPGHAWLPRIDFGRGVCGAAAAERRTIIVADVEAFPGHIACDSRSKSEIVVPVFDRDGALIAVLDVDATEPAAFSETDAAGLEEIVRRVFAA